MIYIILVAAVALTAAVSLIFWRAKSKATAVVQVGNAQEIHNKVDKLIQKYPIVHCYYFNEDDDIKFEINILRQFYNRVIVV